MSPITHNINLFLTQPHRCNYIKENTAQNLITDPDIPPTPITYSSLINKGFRRSGNHIYKPHCQHCQLCISTRIDCRLFKPKKTHQRCLKKNRDLQIIIKDAEFNEEHYQLYSSYLKSKHRDSGMDDCTPADYLNFLTSNWCETRFVEFRLQHKLLAVAVTDFVYGGLSAVYTFYQPESQYRNRSLGVYAILWQIQHCLELDKPWLYLGYWIPLHRKMHYKKQYQPAEYFYRGQWLCLKDIGRHLPEEALL